MSGDSQAHEFLIRDPEGDFRLQTVSSLQAGVFFHPRRISTELCEVTKLQEAGKVSYRIKNIANGKITGLSERGYELWMRMDGKNSLRALAAEFFIKYGSLDVQELRGLIHQLHGAGLIQASVPPLARLRQYLAQHDTLLGRMFTPLLRWTSVDLTIPGVDQKVGLLYQKCGFLFFKPVVLALSVLLGCWASWIFGTALHGQYTAASFLDAPWKWLFAYLALIPILPIHEIAHALTAKHYNYPVRAFGFTLLHHAVPVAYADVTDIWTAPARKRMMVALAGPYVTWILGAASILCAWFFPSWKFLLYLFAFNCYASSVLNLYPFTLLETDGYYVLADILQAPHLRRQTLELFGGVFRARLPKLNLREFFSALFYGLVSVASILGIAWCILWSFYGQSH